MIMIYAPHTVDKTTAHYAAVRAYMLQYGAPVIRVADCGDHFQAIEGSHRLAIAAELGLTPKIDIIDPITPLSALGLDFDLADLMQYDYYDGAPESEDFLTVAHLVEMLSATPTADFAFGE